MTRIPVTFHDPAGHRADYAWHINPSEEEEAGKDRGIQFGAPTENNSLLPQAGPPVPLVFTWKGSIFELAQLTELIAWWTLSNTQTFYVTDFVGDQYEGIISSFKVARKGVAANPRIRTQSYIWTYTMVFTVARVISGTWFGVGS